jgi:Domain of unknown function (DUF4194)
MTDWGIYADRSNGIYTTDQFESAAYRLITEQAIYGVELKSRVAYTLIDIYEREFKQALSLFGVDLIVNRQNRYACALPTHEKLTPATTEQTLLALVLRKIYDESARVGQMNDEGEVVCDLVELEEKYRLATNRELASAARLEELLRTMKRWGIARISKDLTTGFEESIDQPFVVMIRPAIVEILGERTLQRLATFSEAEGNSDTSSENVVDQISEDSE